MFLSLSVILHNISICFSFFRTRFFLSAIGFSFRWAVPCIPYPANKLGILSPWCALSISSLAYLRKLFRLIIKKSQGISIRKKCKQYWCIKCPFFEFNFCDFIKNPQFKPAAGYSLFLALQSGNISIFIHHLLILMNKDIIPQYYASLPSFSFPLLPLFVIDVNCKAGVCFLIQQSTLLPLYAILSWSDCIASRMSNDISLSIVRILILIVIRCCRWQRISDKVAGLKLILFNWAIFYN